MKKIYASEQLLWFEGFGGVVKAEFTAANGALWTVLQCDSGSFTAYGTHPQVDAGPTFEDLNEDKVVRLVNILCVQ